MSTSLLYRLWVTCLCLLSAFKNFGQQYYNQTPQFLKANSVWATLGGLGLDLNTTPPTTIPVSSNNPLEGVASVADPITGALLFYSDGGICWNASNQVMLNGDSLLGNSIYTNGWGQGSTTQGVCIVPFVGQPGKYYLFSMTGPTNWAPPATSCYLYYSVIDMSLDGGLGGIVPGQKNIPLGANIPLSESMIAIPGNNCDIWLMVHEYINPVFKAYHITRQGIDTIPAVSTAGTQLQGINIVGAYFVGGMAISPDRKLIGISSCGAFAIPGISGVLLGKFDAGTGIVDSALQVGQTLTPYTLAFSPDNSKLYVYNADPTFSPYVFEQFDISVFDSATIAASAINLGQDPLTVYLKSYGGKIYAQHMYDSLYVIDQPNLSGIACNYHYAGFVSSTASLPNDVVYALPPDTISIREDTTVCTRNHVFGDVILTAPAGYYGYAWEDGSTGAVHSISAPGTYRVLCKDSCHSLIDSIVVNVRDIPLSLGPDTTICNQAEFILDATAPGNATYLWQDGSTLPVFSALNNGTYWARVSSQGCTVSDTVVLKLLDLRQNLGADIALCKGAAIRPVTLQAIVLPGATVQWSTGGNAPSIIAADTGSYWVTVSEVPCMGSDTMRITVEVCECLVSVPNAFSPNGDGLNDVFLPVIEAGCAVSNYNLNIYNRYGQRVYSGYKTGEGWDGRYPGGVFADGGTYMYELSFAGGTRQVKYFRKGDIVLVR